MNFFEILDTRKTIRKYEEEKPSVEDIKRIINSARLAPSACNTQNWKFIAIYNQEIKNALAVEVLKKYDEFEAKLDAKTNATAMRFKAHSTFFTQAPVLIVCIEKKEPKFLEGVLEKGGYSKEEIEAMRPDSQLLSMGGAIENMSLAAHALGLGSCWMVAPLIAQNGFKKVLNIAKEDKIVSLLTIGFPKGEAGRAPKKDLKEIIEFIE